MAAFDEKSEAIRSALYAEWDASIQPALIEYLKIDNQSPSYDPEERTNGKTEKAMKVLIDWAQQAGLEGAEFVHLEEPNRTPFLLIDIKATEGYHAKTHLMYGHMDKQPPMDDTAPGWDEGLGPYTPVIRDGKLYGRGGADDGYAIFGAVAAVRTLQKQGLPHGHVVIVIEACEESGSFDLMHYIEKIKDRIGDVDLVTCLDSGTLDYETMYLTTSLRGAAGGKLSVSLLTEGVHSGIASGILPDSFRVARILLDRIENTTTGEFLIPEIVGTIPDEVKEGLKYLDADPEVKRISSSLPAHPSVQFGASESVLALRNTWMPTLTVTGADGMPSCSNAGNVLRKETSLFLSIRLPPTVNPVKATEALEKELTRDPPFGARVVFEPEFSGPGWAAPKLAPWTQRLFNAASKAGYARPIAVTGIGGSIPFMGMLGEMFPAAQFCVTGILGPKSNAHGPNEFLHIDYTKKLLVSLTRLVWGHAVEKRD
eukprot:TRINITY_DN27617_c0_g1_i1.p2 TRINITY_DN27617_c0_g1~~TRINITY_DN27617_c0_g1_i1.p2  ORF type:complete len:498 (+),score=227.86 TRINITY_DN27617_c0_g1_i1:43-1494(+)